MGSAHGMASVAFAAGLALGLCLVLAAMTWRLRRRFLPPVDRGDLQAALDAVMAQVSRQDPACTYALGVVKQGRVHLAGYGPPGAAPGPDTLFQLASVSKLLTADTLVWLCDSGRLGLDDALGQLLGPRMALSPAAQRVTLRQLATHTSGFPRVPRGFMRRLLAEEGRRHLMRDPYRLLGEADVIDYLRTTPDLRAPGRFAYSNFGMGLLGHVMAWTQGCGLQSLAQQALFQPLAMADTTLAPDAQQLARLAPGHDARGRPARAWTFGALHGAGAFYSTAQDMLRFITAHLDEAHPLHDRLRRAWPTGAGTGPAGLGWMRATPVDRLLGHGGVVWHDGMVAGYAAYLCIDPGTKSGLVLLGNQGRSLTWIGVRLMRQLRTQSWRAAA